MLPLESRPRGVERGGSLWADSGPPSWPLPLVASRSSFSRARTGRRSAAGAAEHTAKVALKVSESETHVQQALSELSIDPQAGLEHALLAWDVLAAEGMDQTASSENTLRLALSRSHIDVVIADHTDVVWSAWLPALTAEPS